MDCADFSGCCFDELLLMSVKWFPGCRLHSRDHQGGERRRGFRRRGTHHSYHVARSIDAKNGRELTTCWIQHEWHILNHTKMDDDTLRLQIRRRTSVKERVTTQAVSLCQLPTVRGQVCGLQEPNAAIMAFPGMHLR